MRVNTLTRNRTHNLEHVQSLAIKHELGAGKVTTDKLDKAFFHFLLFKFNFF